MNLARSLFCLALSFAASPAYSTARDQAYRMHSRLAGVPPAAAVLDQMEALIKTGKLDDAAKIAMSNPSFYNLTLKNWVAPWTNKDQSIRAPLNDYSATIIGMVRDDIAFTEVLSGDLIYVGKAGLTGVPAYSLANNDHYAALETQAIDLMANLEKQTQSTVTQLGETAGVMTTRGFGSSFFFDGTNRAAVRFTLLTYLCNDLEQLADTTIPDFRIRRDVDRQPGGDANVFRNKCAGCHNVQDPLGGAFAHFDFVNNTVVYDATKVMDKMNKNSATFPDGYVVSDDGWLNMSTTGQNARIGWNGDQSGNGAKAYGRMLTATDEFPVCMAKRVKNAVCLTPVKDIQDDEVRDLAAQFKADNYNMKNLFAHTVSECLGD